MYFILAQGNIVNFVELYYKRTKCISQNCTVKKRVNDRSASQHNMSQ